MWWQNKFSKKKKNDLNSKYSKKSSHLLFVWNTYLFGTPYIFSILPQPQAKLWPTGLVRTYLLPARFQAILQSMLSLFLLLEKKKDASAVWTNNGKPWKAERCPRKNPNLRTKNFVLTSYMISLGLIFQNIKQAQRYFSFR